MKSPLVVSLVANEVVTAQFIVLSKDIRQKKTGEPYLSLHLADRTGEIEAKMWDNVAEVIETFDRDDFIKVKGLMQVYQNRSQFTIHRLRRLEDHEVDFADYFPCSERNSEDMLAELRGIIAGLQNEHLRGLLQSIFEDEQFTALYKLAPAAKTIHHACRGGLIEHVLSLCALCRMTAEHYKGVDRDLLLTGAILHDIGKVRELTYERSFGYSTEGQLLGHIIIGLRMVGEKIDRFPKFPPKLRTLVEHMLISHHGELEFGSPKVPVFLEALLLHHLDNLDSKMEAMRLAVARDQQQAGEFTGWVSALERVVLKKAKYLEDASPKSSAARTAAPEIDDPVPVAAVQQTLTPPSGPPPTPLKPAPPAPAVPQRPPAPPHRSPAANTLFGDKLQAVLNSRE